jgi:hypothetical protein
MHKDRSELKNKILFLILLFLTFFLVGRWSMAEATPAGETPLAETGTHWQSKVEKTLLDDLNSETGQNVVVLFGEKADLKKASSLAWHDRGQMVLHALRNTAQTAQARAVRRLKTHEGAYASYGSHFSANVLQYQGGQNIQTTLCAVFARFRRSTRQVVLRFQPKTRRLH